VGSATTFSLPDEISVEAGFKVQLHVQSEPPFIHELGFGISPGFQTLVATQEQRASFFIGCFVEQALTPRSVARNV